MEWGLFTKLAQITANQKFKKLVKITFQCILMGFASNVADNGRILRILVKIELHTKFIFTIESNGLNFAPYSGGIHIFKATSL